MEYLLFLVACTFGSALAWRALRESCAVLVVGLGPLLGSSALVALSNARLAPSHSLALLAVLTMVLVALPGREKLVWRPMTRLQGGTLGFMLLVVLGFTLYSQVHVLDGDRYLHDAHIVAFQRGIYPPVNPFFPELAMNGHFGRDLLMATLTSDGVDPAYTTWWVQPWIQLATMLTLFASIRAFTESNQRGLLVAAMIFFGMDCGFRVGLIDTFDGSNGLAHPHFVLLFYLMFRVFQGARWPVWLVAGVVLGTYQLIYMTNFALLLLTGVVLFALKARSRQAWVGLLVTGLLAVGLALTEGGAFTDMAQRGLHPELDKAVQNQGLRVTVQFPKDELFQVLTSTAGYYRTSVAYQTSLFKGLHVPPKGEGYISIFSLDFLRGQWLPLYLAPLSLWILRRSALGLAFWLIGAISYLLPGLFYFGPIFEYEFFRFSFSAAFGFAGALGLAMGEWLEPCPITLRRDPLPTVTLGRGTFRFLAAVAILFASLLAGEKTVNDAIIASQKRGFEWFPNMRQWRLAEPTFALSEDILKGCDYLRSRTSPGQQVLTNFLTDRPMGLWPDAVAATLSGVFPAGHAFPSQTEGRPHGSPAYHQSAMAREFWASGDLTGLEGSKVAWLLADTSKLEPSVVKKLEALPHEKFGTILAAQVPAVPAPTSSLASSPSPSSSPSPFPSPSPSPSGISSGPRSASEPEWSASLSGALPSNETLRLGARYPISLNFVNAGPESRATLKLDNLLVETLRFKVPKGGGVQNVAFVTPWDEGTYKASVLDTAGKEQFSFSFTIDFIKRLESLSCAIDFPQLKAQRFYTLVGRWESAAPLHSVDELDFAYRFRRPDGDYAWEVDLIPQPVNLALPESPEFKLQVFTPLLPGAYELEIWFFDRGSGRQVKIQKSFPVVIES